MRYCLDLTSQQTTLLLKLQEEVRQAQLRFAVAVEAISAGRGIPDGANWVGFQRLIPEGATHLNGALPKCEGVITMLDFEVPEQG